MIFEQESFLDNYVCDYLIAMHECNEADKLHRDTEVISMSEYYHDNIIYRYVISKCSNYVQTVLNDSNIFPNYSELVKWIKNGQGEHKDFSYHYCTSIVYLNDNFEGGETYINGTNVEPKKGKIVCFKGREHTHGVNPITKGFRYTMPTWYLHLKELQFK